MYSPESKQSQNLTPYQEVNDIAGELMQGVTSILKNQLVGIYLHGSLASGDFNPKTSDIDFLVVTDDNLNPTTVEQLRKMHAQMRITENSFAQRIEGSYIPITAMKGYNRENAFHPALSYEGEFKIGGHGYDWIIQRAIIRDNAVIVLGPEPSQFIAEVSPEQIRYATKMAFQDWWQPKLIDQSFFTSAEYQVFTVLTMCRTIYSYTHGDYSSKRTAAEWVMKTFSEFNPLVASALCWEKDDEFNQLLDVLQFLKFIQARL